ncbi:MAG: Gfo/Idh/MocA family oxidoreductase [Candidatus Bathyarchaeia archaeon]|nr:Gfo/Idh/MocA family oxidoreductase [Candidatus Bathyarchaeota archaeon]
MEKLKVGVAGFGSWGRRHYDSWKRIEGVEIVGVYDPAYKGEIFWDSLESLLKNVDALDVVVPAHSLADVAIKALEYSKHVLIEKPMATDALEARRLLKVVRGSKGRVVMVGFIERFNPIFLRLHSIIDSLQGPGRIFCQRSGAPTLVAKKTGVLKDLAIHDLDLLRWYLGEPRRVVVKSKEDFYFSQVEVSFDDVHAIVISDCLGPKIRRWILTYPDDSLFAYFENDRWRLYMNQREVKINWVMPLESELRYFANCIREGLEPSPSVEDGLRALEIIEGAEVQD